MSWVLGLVTPFLLIILDVVVSLAMGRGLAEQLLGANLPPACATCGYLLVGLPEPRCPECGTPFDPEHPRPQRERPAEPRLDPLDVSWPQRRRFRRR